MTAKPVNMPAWEKWAAFKTFGDPQLEEMLLFTAGFVQSMKNKERPHWLTFTGTSGAGKTYLAKRISRWVRETKITPNETIEGEVVYGHEFCFWPDLADELRNNRGREWFSRLPHTKFVLLDDIGAAQDNTGNITGRLSELLGRRVGKWTILTCNLPLHEIAAKIDTRVASRIIRDGNVIVDVDVVDYSLRK